MYIIDGLVKVSTQTAAKAAQEVFVHQVVRHLINSNTLKENCDSPPPRGGPSDDVSAPFPSGDTGDDVDAPSPSTGPRGSTDSRYCGTSDTDTNSSTNIATSSNKSCWVAAGSGNYGNVPVISAIRHDDAIHTLKVETTNDVQSPLPPC